MEWVGAIAFRQLRFKILPPCRESSRRFFEGFGVSFGWVKKKWFCLGFNQFQSLIFGVPE